MSLTDDINNLPATPHDVMPGHLNHHATIHSALKNNNSRLTTVEDDLPEIKWKRGNVFMSHTSLDQLVDGAWTIPGATQARNLGMPEEFIGALLLSTTTTSRVALYITNAQSSQSGSTHLPPRLWLRASNNDGEWGDWVRVPTLDDIEDLQGLQDLQWYSPTNVIASQHYESMSVGSWSVPSGSLATSIGMPVPRAGNLEILRATANGLVKIARFTTNDVRSDAGIEIWHRASDSRGGWPRPWVQTYPPEAGGGTDEGRVLDLIIESLTNYVTTQDLVDELSALPVGPGSFGIDPDGVPYIMIGAE